MNKINLKKEGSSLIVAIFLSGLVLTIGITASRLLLKETQFSADAILSEKAYFSAESGVEVALLELKTQPVQHIDKTTSPLPFLEYDLSIINRIEPIPSAPIKNKFEFTLGKLQNQQFRLRYDQDDSPATNISEVSNFKLTAVAIPSGSTRYQWKISCQDAANQTQVIQKTETLASIPNFLDYEGCLSTDIVPLSFALSDPCKGFPRMKFNNWSAVSKDTCFFSIQNLSNNNIKFTFSEGTMAPHQAKIISIGKSKNREKHIVFDYAQKNIGSLFNFTFLHTESGL